MPTSVPPRFFGYSVGLRPPNIHHLDSKRGFDTLRITGTRGLGSGRTKLEEKGSPPEYGYTKNRNRLSQREPKTEKKGPTQERDPDETHEV